MSVMMTTHSNDLPDNTGLPFPATNGKLRRLRAAPEQHVLAVEFRSPDGRCWNAIGGGSTVAAAITYARESCPADTSWDAVSWNDLYGK